MKWFKTWTERRNAQRIIALKARIGLLRDMCYGGSGTFPSIYFDRLVVAQEELAMREALVKLNEKGSP